MRYFLDTEFSERPSTIELISLGLVSEDGRELYLESSEFDDSACNAWVKANVLPHLGPKDQRDSRAGMRLRLFDFILQHEAPEFWGYYAAYDWVAFCWIFGPMADLPHGWPMMAYDLRQWLDHKGLKHVRQPDDMPHHALSDARWIRDTFLRHRDTE